MLTVKSKSVNLLLAFALVASLFALQAQQKAHAAMATGSKFVGNIIAGSVPSNFGTYWNQVTPENGTKWGSVEGSRNSMNWSQADISFNYAKTNGLPFKFHTLVWGSQEPGWISGLSAADQKAEVTQWIQAAAARYGTSEYVDVVNEPLHAKPSYRNAIGGDGSTGWDWVIWSFEQARQAFPNSKLLINDYGIIGDPNAAAQYVTIINLLKARGLVDGIGIQCHYFNMDTVSVSTMNSVLNTLSATGLPIYVSELDMTGDDATQLSRYQTKFPVLYENSNVKGITLWGYIQGQTWADNTHLVTSSGAERPALTWLKQYLGSNTNPTVPAAPTGLTATAGNAQVALSWAASSGATSYTVKRATTSGGTYTNVATNVTTTSYTDTGVTNGTTYYYVVSASNSAGSSANSAQASATPTGGTTPTVPAAPSGLTATAGNAQVALSWAASTGATSYTVKRATTSGGTYTNVATNVTATSYTDTSVTNGTTYYYVVSASNSAGSSANSAQASATPTGGGTTPTGSLVAQYKVNNANATDNQIYATFNIKNTGTSAVNLSDVKLRYYFTKDSSATLNSYVDWAQIGGSNVNRAFVSTTGTNADTYLELSFSSGAGSIPAGGQSGDIQIRISKSDWSNFNESNDYSFDGTKSAFADWNKITLLQSGTVVWGVAP
ncbi:endo-1,4-beta-xylanase [Paenibacillus kobensis]|uniref:endo-1,4-beta-xylanase n=1 Tax=Paenibacillus kobensis TaxID=59841 RepID=UPI000FDA51C5|nr:endo-1,4-beta-xylanase [Paenibacillus kobensis]